MALLKPKEVTVKDVDGIDHTYTISRFPCIAGREIVTQWPISAMPKVGDYAVNEAIVLKMMAYVGVKPKKGEMILLENQTLVENHVPDYECLMRLEAELMGYNTTFFGKEKLLAFSAGLGENLKGWIISILTALSERSLQTTKPRSKS